MPIIESAKKQMRKSIKAREKNRLVKDKFRRKVKAVNKNIAAGGKNIEKITAEAVSAIDKAAKKGVIHQGAANRRKSRLMKTVNKTLKKPVELATIREKQAPLPKPKKKVSSKSKVVKKVS